MERALQKLRAADGSPAWRETVLESSVVFTRGLTALLDGLRAGDVPSPPVPPEQLLKARKYARVKVAEMQLYGAAQVQAGCESRDLYSSLKAAIDDARAGYRREFLSVGSRIPDFLHEELVRVLARDDEALLGPHYPGPLR